MIVARRFTISGRVQGVGFRWFAKDVADREGVSGWVRNLPDGRVEAVTRVERSLRMGPRGARIATFRSDDELPQRRASSFDIVS